MDGIFSWTEVTMADDMTTVTYRSWLLNDVVLSDIGNDGDVDGYTVINNGLIKYAPDISEKERNRKFQEELERFGVR